MTAHRVEAREGGFPSPAKAPCKSCPYRQDVPSGIWDISEYQKLPQYDGDTMEQRSAALFFCHQKDGHLCAGWVGCHDTTKLLALRLHQVAPATFDYESPIPLFASGREACSHGMSAAANPSKEAKAIIARIVRKQKGQRA